MYVILKDVYDVDTLEHILIKMSLFYFFCEEKRRKLCLRYLFLFFIREQTKKRLKCFDLSKKRMNS